MKEYRDYHINIFWSDEDDCYIADIPDLKYCSAFGDTGKSARRGTDRKGSVAGRRT